MLCCIRSCFFLSHSATELHLVKFLCVMAAPTIPAKTTGMSVIVAVAARTLAAGFHAGTPGVTVLAEELGMAPGQAEIGLLVMVKFPACPVGGVVALLALLAKVAFVVIILLVTVDAGTGHLAVSLVDMAAVARQTGMQAQQGKAAHVVIKANLFPAGLPVALVALLPQLTAMGIIASMAAVAAGGTFKVNGAAEMTGLAGLLGVFTSQRKLGVLVMIETHILPALVVMAILALGTVAATVHIIAAVTAIAGIAGNLFHLHTHVTSLAAQAGVRTQQIEVGFLIVFEA
jgi:hypothetical protein